ncbi:hypothetical protein KPH14_007488 [Odynerus spinipes]|uniref:Uncharacterized protein n=1 Tax=Odynerus spinipes TaxID=1348599 RepID=A0AAD9RAL1_9HYME|nr:hypothetical protein KPH14_007488 [Odynerus spinipes]
MKTEGTHLILETSYPAESRVKNTARVAREKKQTGVEINSSGLLPVSRTRRTQRDPAMTMVQPVTIIMRLVDTWKFALSKTSD